MHKRLRISCTNLPQLPGRRMQSGTMPITLNDTDMKSGKIMVIGSSNTDMTVFTQRHPEPGETVLGGHFRMGAGGKGANQAVAARRLGGDVSFVCKVGPDLFGDNAIRHYRDEGLDVSGVMRSDSPSGVALITVDASGENSIVVASGANADITVEETVNQLEQDIGFSAKELVIFFYTPTMTEGVSSMKMYSQTGFCFFQDNSWGDANREKYYRIEVDTTNWLEWHQYESNSNATMAPTTSSIAEQYNVTFPTESPIADINKLKFVAAKGILKNSRIIIYAR